MVAMWKLAHYARVFWSWQIRQKQTLAYLPEEISLEATNVCNFKCAFCPQSDPAHHEINPRTYLAAVNADTIFSRLRQAGVRTNVLHWTLDGEPFMHRQFHALCVVALRHGFTHMYFATNALLCTDDNLRRLPSEGARYTFTIDYCADEAQFEEIRGTKGSWSKVWDNLLNVLQSDDLRHIHLQVTDISPYTFSDLGEQDRRLAALRHMFPPSTRLIVRSKTFHNAAGTVSGPAGAPPPRKYHTCPYPWTSLNVTSSGDVVACCRDLRRQTVLGNLLRQSLPEVWNGEEYQTLRRNLLTQRPALSKACNGCDMPYNAEKFSMTNVIKTAKGRLQIFSQQS
jgi:radical SAM protein with 4Fe4S-binding SPASM domain